MAIKPGTRLGVFEIVGLIGAGGMGEVYRALDTRLDRQVAIKVLGPRHFTDLESKQRLKREAKTIARITHANICTLHDLGEQDGLVYLVFECLDGASLETLLAKPIPFAQFLGYAIEIADALDAAHHKGVIHRDIKPGNIFITQEGHAKVLDFGLAKLLSEAVQDSNIATTTFGSSTGTTVGTAGYMSPEQVLGRDLDNRSDLFSLGIVLYRGVTGTSPFPGHTLGEISDAVLHKHPILPSRLNPALPLGFEQIVLKALEKDPELRYQSAAELRADLKRIKRDSESSMEVPTSSVSRPAATHMRKWAVAAAVLITLGIASVVLTRGQREKVASGPVKQRQLTANAAEVPVYTAAISPDGKHLAYSDPTGFYIAILNSGETHALKLPPGFCFR
ncbi:MAG TPA: serine/threonine-protein kinase [Terriglobales bacterium]|nr:serine/threonine-protein kinase [Terriglobales bacterium]